MNADETVNKTKKPSLVSGRAAYAQPVEPVRWLIDGVLRSGRKRIALLASQPECGKTSLSRQAAVAVAQGGTFLDRQCKRGEVILWQSEDTVADVAVSLRNLGWNPDRDEMIHILCEDATNSLVALRDALRETPKVIFVVVETLDSLFKVDDIKENSCARKSFDAFDKLVGHEFCHRVDFLGLHHLKKGDSNRDGELLMGATEIRGRTGDKLYLKMVNDDDDRRIFHNVLRGNIGTPIKKTYLLFDRTTETSTLGITVAEERKNSIGSTEANIEKDILTCLANNPEKYNKEEIIKLATGHSDAKRKVFKRLERENRIEMIGNAAKGSKGVYRLPAIPVEQAKTGLALRGSTDTPWSIQ